MTRARATTRSRDARDGFTLLEVMVALTVGGLVALLVFGTLGAGLDTGERLRGARERDRAEVVVRALLEDALRHASEATGADFAFAIDDAIGDDGRPRDAMRVATRGVLTPLGASARYVLDVSVHEEGLRVVAAPVDSLAGPRLESVLPGVAGLDVRAQSIGERAWRDGWTNAARRPAAVALRLVGRDGVEERLVVRVAGEGAP